MGEAAPPTPTPRVQHLEFANPLEVILLGGIAIAGAVGYVVPRISNAVASAAEAASKVQAVGHERNEEQCRNERHQLEMRSLQLDNLKQAVELSDVLERIHPAIREIAGVEIPELSPGQQARAEGLKDQAVEAATELVLSSREDVAISDDEPPASDPRRRQCRSGLPYGPAPLSHSRGCSRPHSRSCSRTPRPRLVELATANAHAVKELLPRRTRERVAVAGRRAPDK